MKKTLLLAAFGIFSLTGFAQTSKTYTDDLIVTINDQSTPAQESNIDFVNHEDGTCDFVLKNFVLFIGEDAMLVGNIELKNVSLSAGDSYNTFTVEQVINILPGDMEGIPTEAWVGPLLGDVPIKMNGKINENQLYCTIDIDMMASLQQIIKVTFGKDITTGISFVKTENSKVNVYSIDGVLLYKGINANSLNNTLPSGLYIVNGKKILVK